jgi:hypothetical protein
VYGGTPIDGKDWRRSTTGTEQPLSVDQTTHFTAAYDDAAAFGCDILASTAESIGRSLESDGNPIACEFLALADRLHLRGDDLRRGELPLPGTGRQVAHLRLLP